MAATTVSPDSAPTKSSSSQSNRDYVKHPSPDAFIQGTFKGEPAITIPKEIETSLAARFDKCLIGKFSQGRPCMEAIRKFLSVQNFQGIVADGLLDKNHVLLRFELIADYVHLFSRSNWSVNGKPMRILKWTPDFHIDRESSIIPIWISLPKLPIHLTNEGFIFSLVSSFSKPLRIDTATEDLKRPSVARVQVEFDLLKMLPSRVWVQSENGSSFWQAIAIEGPLPSYCNFCWHIGHQEYSCPVKHPEIMQARSQKHRPYTHKEFRPKTKAHGVRSNTILQEKENSTEGTSLQDDNLPANAFGIIDEAISDEKHDQADRVLLLQVSAPAVNKANVLGNNETDSSFGNKENANPMFELKLAHIKEGQDLEANRVSTKNVEQQVQVALDQPTQISTQKTNIVIEPSFGNTTPLI